MDSYSTKACNCIQVSNSDTRRNNVIPSINTDNAILYVQGYRTLLQYQFFPVFVQPMIAEYGSMVELYFQNRISTTLTWYSSFLILILVVVGGRHQLQDFTLVHKLQISHKSHHLMLTLLLYIILSDFAVLDPEEAPPLEYWGWQVRIIFTLMY